MASIPRCPTPCADAAGDIRSGGETRGVLHGGSGADPLSGGAGKQVLAGGNDQRQRAGALMARSGLDGHRGAMAEDVPIGGAGNDVRPFGALSPARLRLALGCGTVSVASWGLGFALGTWRGPDVTAPATSLAVACAACLLAAAAWLLLRSRATTVTSGPPCPAPHGLAAAVAPRRRASRALQAEARPGRALLQRRQRGLR